MFLAFTVVIWIVCHFDKYWLPFHLRNLSLRYDFSNKVVRTVKWFLLLEIKTSFWYICNVLYD